MPHPDGDAPSGLTDTVKMVFSPHERNFLTPPVYFQCDRFQNIRTAGHARPAAAEPPSLPGEMIVL
jgi:hypothetical protein